MFMYTEVSLFLLCLFLLIYVNVNVNVNVNQSLTSLEWPRGFQEVKVPRFHDNGTGWW